VDPNQFALVGALVGSALGIVGGVVGTGVSVRNASGPRERSFLLRAAAVFWMALIAFLTFLLTTPLPYRPLIWIPYPLALLLAIRALNRRQHAIRADERARS
jgi:Ca2+/Na+ antiporter